MIYVFVIYLFTHSFINCLLTGNQPTSADPNATTTTADPNATTTTADPNATTTTADPNATTTSVSTPTPDIWEENDMIWSVDQCPSILWFDGITLDDCQNFCSSVSTCTAINFGEETGHCTLLNCGYPCPEPMWSASNYKGYCLERGKLSFYQKHELLFHTFIIC